MNRYDNAYGRNEYGSGGDFGLFGSYPSAAMAPPAVASQFSAAPPSLMSIGAMPPPNAPVPLSAQNFPPPSAAVVPPPASHLHPGVQPSLGSVNTVPSGSAGMSTAGVNTNSRHPLALKARVFVGNLNTNAVTREELEQLFRRFGDVLAVSIHRGYGFVQYPFEYEARNAISFTDGMILGGQRLDVNLASEPKPGRDVKPNKRQADTNVSETPNKKARSSSEGRSQPATNSTPKPLFPSKAVPANVEITTTSVVTTLTNKSPTKLPATTPKSTPANIPVLTKKTEPKVASNPNTTSALKTIPTTKTKTEMNGSSETSTTSCPAAPGVTGSTPDILICGHCRVLFGSLASFTTHRKENPNKACVKNTPAPTAAASTTATTAQKATASAKVEGEPETLSCCVCQKQFEQAWNLIVHVSKEHNITVYHTNKTAAAGKSPSKAEATKEDPAEAKQQVAASKEKPPEKPVEAVQQVVAPKDVVTKKEAEDGNKTD